MIRIFLTLLLSVVCGLGAAGTAFVAPVAPFGANTKIATSANQFTNAVINATSGTLIVVPVPLVIPAMTNLWKNGVHYFFYPGAGLTSMNGATDGWFDDTDSARTSIVSGAGSFVMSNNVPFANLISPSSYLGVQCDSIWKANTNHTVGVFNHGAGRLVVHAHKELRSEGYDIYINSLGTLIDPDCYASIFADKWFAAEDAIEISNPIETPGQAFFRGTLFEKLTNTTAATSSEFMLLNGHVVVEADTINLNTNAMLQGGNAADGTYPLIDARIITARSDSKVPITSTVGGLLRIRGARIIGPTAVDPIFAAQQIYLEDCEIVSGASATNSIRGSSGVSVEVVGSLKIDKPVHHFIAVNGPTTGLVYTNSYDAANVFVNIGGNSHQALVATNSFTLIPTNSTGLATGKTIRFDVINNQSTGVVVTVVANCKLQGQGHINSTSFSITNSRHANLFITAVGTNRIVTVSP